METTRVKQLVEEIQELMRQYHAEVGSKRKPWPKSIKGRVRDLFALGVPSKKAAELIDIPYATIMSWRLPAKSKMNEHFHSLAVRSDPTVRVGKSDHQNPRSNLTVTVRTPDGWTLEIPSEIFSKIFVELRGGQ